MQTQITLKYYPEDVCNWQPRVTAWLFCHPVKYLIHISGGHFFQWPQWAPGWALWQKNHGERDNDCLCTLLHVCACGKGRDRCVQTHTPPKSHSSSQVAQTISGPILFNHVSASTFSLIFPLPPCCKGEGNEAMRFLIFLYIAIMAQHPVLLGGKGRGEHTAGSDEQAVGT